MYTLRKITEARRQYNFALGENYQVLDKYDSPEQFKEQMQSYQGIKYEPEWVIYAFVLDQKCNVHPLFEKERNYIMTENGNTFSNLSIK